MIDLEIPLEKETKKNQKTELVKFELTNMRHVKNDYLHFTRHTIVSW
jgi:hypothetical protein